MSKTVYVVEVFCRSALMSEGIPQAAFRLRPSVPGVLPACSSMKQKSKMIHLISLPSVEVNFLPLQLIDFVHPAGTSINLAFCEEIRKFCLAFTMVVYEKIFGSINK